MPIPHAMRTPPSTSERFTSSANVSCDGVLPVMALTETPLNPSHAIADPITAPAQREHERFDQH